MISNLIITEVAGAFISQVFSQILNIPFKGRVIRATNALNWTYTYHNASTYQLVDDDTVWITAEVCILITHKDTFDIEAIDVPWHDFELTEWNYVTGTWDSFKARNLVQPFR